MKKLIILLIILVSSISLVSASEVLPSMDSQISDSEKLRPLLDDYFKKDVDIKFISHLYVDTAMLFGYPTVGATWDMGIKIDTVSIAAYLRFGHFFKPLGSNTGKFAAAEELGEAGLSMKIRIYELGRFNVNLGINTAWYQQWVMLSSNAGTYNLANNGLLIRPEASIGWRAVGWWNIELGLFYQTPLYPAYDGYRGWGCFIKII